MAAVSADLAPLNSILPVDYDLVFQLTFIQEKFGQTIVTIAEFRVSLKTMDKHAKAQKKIAHVPCGRVIDNHIQDVEGLCRDLEELEVC